MSLTVEEIVDLKAAIRQYLACELKIPQDTIMVKDMSQCNRFGICHVTIKFSLTGIKITWLLEHAIRKNFNIWNDLSRNMVCVGSWMAIGTNSISRSYLKRYAGFKVQARLAELETENADLRAEILHLRYSPGGSGYLDAKEHFEDMQKIQ